MLNKDIKSEAEASVLQQWQERGQAQGWKCTVLTVARKKGEGAGVLGRITEQLS